MNITKMIVAVVMSVSGCLMVNTVGASELSYDNVGVSYQYMDFGSGNGHLNGATFDFTKSITDNIFATAKVDHVNLTGRDFSSYKVGIGGRLGLSSDTDLYAMAHGTNTRSNGLVGDAWGWGVEAGIRSMVTNVVELRGGLATERLNKAGFGEWGTAGLVGASYFVTDSVALTADARLFREGGHQYGVGVQYNF